MGSLGPMEIVLIVAVIFLLFGAKKIPEMMRGLGSGIKEFKKAANEVADSSSGTTNITSNNTNTNTSINSISSNTNSSSSSSGVEE